MADDQISLSDYAVQIGLKEIDLLKRKGEVSEFLRTEHNSEVSKKWIEDLHGEEAEIDKEIMEPLLKSKASLEFKEEAEKLCGSCDKLYDRIKRMYDDLYRDYEEKRSIENGKKAAAAQSASLTVITTMLFVTAQVNGVFDHLKSIWLAAAAGIIVANVYNQRDELAKKFVSASKALFEKRKKTEDGISGEVNEVEKHASLTKKTFGEEAKALGGWISKMPARTKRSIKKILNISKPKR